MTDDLDDRLSRRFEADDGAEADADTASDDGGEHSQPAQNAQNAQAAENTQNTQNAQMSQVTQNIKKEWNVRSFYLDDDLDDDLTMAFKRLDLSVSEAETDVDLQKTRHFYPLVVELGLERLEEMDVGAITDRLENK